MYLLLVENNYISSREIYCLLQKNKIDCEIVNCSSSDSLLDLAEKIEPDLIIIDFDLFGEDSASIVTKLRRFSPGAYILAFVDPDQYNLLHQAIDDGIDNYMVKPLHRDDVDLRIKMGLQQKHNLGGAREADQVLITELFRQAPEAEQETAADSKKLFKDLADLFGRQFETEAGQPDNQLTSVKEEAALETEVFPAPVENPELIDKIDRIEDEGKGALKAAATDLRGSDLAPRPESEFSWPGSGDIGAGVVSDAVDDPLAAKAVEEPADFAEADDQTLLGLSSDPEIARTIDLPERSGSVEPPELSLIDEAFSLVNHLEDPVEIKPDRDHTETMPGAKTEADAVLDFKYFDDLFTREPISESKPEEIQELQTTAPAYHEPETVFDQEPDLPPMEMKSSQDDKELFGVTSRERPVDRSTFEDLFDYADHSAKAKIKVTPEAKTRKNQLGKVEYLPAARKSSTATTSVPFARAVEIQREQSAVPEKSKLVKAKKKQQAKVKHKPPVEKQNVSGGNFLQVAGNIVTALLLIILVGLSFFLIQSRISGGSPAVAGYQIYVVLSGSMSPAFDTGSIVFVKPAEPTEIVVGDIITFSSAGDATRLTTHRVVGLNRDQGLSFITRGDANNVNDPNPVPAENVVGRVTGSVPYVGYLFGFAQTRQGLILLIFLPGLLLIALEMRRLFKYMVDARVQQLSGSAPAENDPEGSSPPYRESEESLPIPGSLRDRSLKDFGF